MANKRKRTPRLKTPTDVERLLAKTIGDIQNHDGSDPELLEKADRIIKACNSILRSFETVPHKAEHEKKRSGALEELTKLIGGVARQITDDQDE